MSRIEDRYFHVFHKSFFASIIFHCNNFSSRNHLRLDRSLRNGMVLRAFSSVHCTIVHCRIIYRRRMTKHNLHRRLRVAKWAAVWSHCARRRKRQFSHFCCVYTCVCGYVYGLVAFLHTMHIHSIRDSRRHSCTNNPGLRLPILEVWRVKSWRRGFNCKLGMFCDYPNRYVWKYNVLLVTIDTISQPYRMRF